MLKIRIQIAKYLILLGGLIQALAIMVLRPKHLIEFSRQFYQRQDVIDLWTGDDCLGRGLSTDENLMLDQIPKKEGNLLILGVGGGREAIPLGRMGFNVTGVDFIPEPDRTRRGRFDVGG